MKLLLFAVVLLLISCLPPEDYTVSAKVLVPGAYALRIRLLDSTEFHDYTGADAGQQDWPGALTGRNCFTFAVLSATVPALSILRDGTEVASGNMRFTWVCFDWLKG